MKKIIIAFILIALTNSNAYSLPITHYFQPISCPYSIPASCNQIIYGTVRDVPSDYKGTYVSENLSPAGYYRSASPTSVVEDHWYCDQYLHATESAFYLCSPDEDICMGVTPEIADSDGDGIPDLLDPTPNDSAKFKFRLFQSQGIDGNMTYMEFINEDGERWAVGTYDPNATTYISIGNTFRDSDDYMDFLSDQGMSSPASTDVESEGGEQIAMTPATSEPSETATGTDQGTDNTGNTTDTDYLADIVSNTKATADNLSRLGDYLADINKNIKNLRNDGIVLSGTPTTVTSSDTDGDPGTPTDGITEAEVKNANKEALAEERAAADTDVQNNLSHISGQTDPVYDTDYAPGDLPEEENLTTTFDNLINNNPVTNYVTNTTVSLTAPVCSFDWEWKGKTIPFSICQFESNLETFGNILVGLAGLVSILIVFRR